MPFYQGVAPGYTGLFNSAQFAVMNPANFTAQYIAVDDGSGVLVSYWSNGVAWIAASDSNPTLARVVFEGDSRTAQGTDPSVGFTSYGYQNWIRALGRFKFASHVLAVAGNTATNMLARLAQVRALQPVAVSVWCGVNALSAAAGAAGSGAAEAARIITCARSYLDGGARIVVLILETGANGWNSLLVAQMVALNNALIAYAQTDSRVRIVNSLGIFVDFTAATQVPITYVTGVLADTVHPTVNASYQLGARIATMFDTLFAPADTGAFLVPGDTSNLLVNAGFQATGAGGYSAGWSGTTVNSWFGFQDGAATVVLTPQATPGQANLREMQLAITTVGPATVQIFQDPIAGVVNGDRLVGSMELEVTGTPVNVVQFQSSFFTLVGGVSNTAWPLFWTAGFDPASPGSSWPQIAMTQYSPETSPTLIGAGGITNVRFGAQIAFRGAGSATLKIRKPYVKRVAAGYIS
jgi:hypothetical protein